VLFIANILLEGPLNANQMIYIIDCELEKEINLSFKQIMYAQLVAIKKEDGSYYLLKDRFKGRQGLHISAGLLAEYVKEVLI
jgi:hypothetical protein